MFVRASRYHRDTRVLVQELDARDKLIAALQSQVANLEKSRHQFVEAARYVIESGSDVVRTMDADRGEELCELANTLPFLLSGRRHWDGPRFKQSSEGMRSAAERIASDNGFELPKDPVAAVMALFDLATALFSPGRSVPLETLRKRFPAEPRPAVRGDETE